MASTTTGDSLSRKERRKQNRLSKKKRKQPTLSRTVDKDGPLPKIPPPTAAAKKPNHKASINTQKSTASKKRKRDIPDERSIKIEDPYAHLDSQTAAALRRDDEEIAALELKLKAGEKGRLNREYAKLECYGDDFGDFLDNLDAMVRTVVTTKSTTNGTSAQRTLKELEEDDLSSSENEEISVSESVANSSNSSSDEEDVPMKDPAFDDLDDDDSVLDELEALRAEERDRDAAKLTSDRNDRNYSESSSDEDTDSEAEDQEPDHDKSLTYRPSEGEDIYGKSIDSSVPIKASKYVPPHLRGQDNSAENDQARHESLRSIVKSLNSALNRLSQDTLIPVAQSLAKLYSTCPTTDVNDCIFKNTQNACVARGQVMTGLIPIYMAALAGAHILKGDDAQLGEFLIEKIVTELCNELKRMRELSRNKMTEDDETTHDENIERDVSKEACNLMLLLCYAYNFGLVHCTLLYDMIRDLIHSLQEIDTELLLLVLSHCGRALRSDDPSALKEIILMVQTTVLERTKEKSASSRSQYMISAMMDLKNNKRRKTDQPLAEKTTQLRKSLGHLKSSSNAARSGDSSLRISLQDILDVETKGRWWKVGASWAGNEKPQAFTGVPQKQVASDGENTFDDKLLKLAAKYRMNTDVRRSVFCIIMGSSDYEDCFEKLVRTGMLKNRTERDTVRVLMECCGNEKAFNNFYALLAARICEYQMQCKFTLQLAFWDTFKQFDELKARKTANLAKLLFHLIVQHNSLKLSVVKVIDMAASEDLPENGMIFLTIFFSSIVQHFDDPADTFRFFDGSIPRRNKSETMDLDSEDNAIEQMNEYDGLRANITVFLVQVMKGSPKCKKGSKFRANLKAAIKACDSEKMR